MDATLAISAPAQIPPLEFLDRSNGEFAIKIYFIAVQMGASPAVAPVLR